MHAYRSKHCIYSVGHIKANERVSQPYRGNPGTLYCMNSHWLRKHQGSSLATPCFHQVGVVETCWRGSWAGSGEGVAPPRWRVQGGAAEAGHRGLEERQNVHVCICIRYTCTTQRDYLYGPGYYRVYEWVGPGWGTGFV